MTDPVTNPTAPPRGPRSWETALFGPVPRGRSQGASFNRWKRLSVGVSITAKLWGQRLEMIATMASAPGPADHVALVLDGGDTLDGRQHGICGAQGCQYLGPSRTTADEALADAARHAKGAR